MKIPDSVDDYHWLGDFSVCEDEVGQIKESIETEWGNLKSSLEASYRAKEVLWTEGKPPAGLHTIRAYDTAARVRQICTAIAESNPKERPANLRDVRKTLKNLNLKDKLKQETSVRRHFSSLKLT